ncbi:MAG TPA: hypothetical protein VHH73_11590 [Verrucomicrobiae bacterium]|nr:hypothetical protein [Verrucomicrobiae bacterium]
MKALVIFALMLAAVSGSVWFTRQSELATLREELGRKQNKPGRIAPVAASAPPDAVVTPGELARLRALPAELARLRGTVSSLRQQTNRSPEQLETKADETEKEARLVRDQRAARQKSKEVANALGTCLMVVITLATETDGTVPASWEEVRSRLDQVKDEKSRLFHLKRSFDWMRSEGKGVELFEILPVPAGTRLVNGQTLDLPILRERQPRPQPDGGSRRYYGALNWQTGEAFAEDNDFTAWEAKFFKTKR